MTSLLERPGGHVAAPEGDGSPLGLRGRLRGLPRPLLLLVALALLQGVCWATVTAPLQGPDEVAHSSYLQYLAETGQPPSFSGGHRPESTQVGDALFYLYLRPTIGVPSAKPSWTAFDLRNWRSIESRLTPAERADASGPNSVAKNPPLYYAYASVPYLATGGRHLFTWLYAARLASVLWLGAVVALTWAMAAQLFDDTLRRTVATAFVALQPELGFIGSVINPDIMLTAEWAAFITLGLVLLRRGPSFWPLFGSVAVVTAGVLTQGRGLPMIPALVLLLGILWRTHRGAGAIRWRGLLAGIVFAAGALLVYRLALHQASGAYGGEIQFRSPRPFDPGEFLSQVWQFYLPKLAFMPARLGPDYGAFDVWVKTFWGAFGSLDVYFPPRIYDALQAFMVVLSAGVVAGLVWARARVPWDRVAFVGGLVVLLVGFLHLASYRNLLGTADPLIVGRYLLPVVPVLGVALAFVLSPLPRRAMAYTSAVLLSGEMLLALTGLGRSLIRFYG